MRGDADINPAQGSISIDRTDPDNPVIRFVGVKQKNELKTAEFIHPFTIRWSTKVGGWMVALGDISYNGAEISVTDIENVDGWPDPWYKVTTLEAEKRSGYVYLHIKEDNTALITFDETIDEKPLLTIRLAYVHYRDGEDEDGGLRVQQLVTSSIYLAGGARWMDPQLETE